MKNLVFNKLLDKIFFKLKVILWNKLFENKKVFKVNKEYHSKFLSSLKEDIEILSMKTEWSSNLIQIYNNFLIGDKDSFLRFPIIQQTIHPPIFNLSKRYFDFLVDKKLFTEYLCKYAIENPVGNPFIDPNFKLSSPILIQHTYNLYMILTHFNINIKTIDLIFEFGAGYGSFVRLLKNAGYSKKHFIFDLPFMTKLQKMYLKNVFEDHTLNEKGVLDNIFYYSDIEKINDINIEKNKNNLFVATWSLSEAPFDVREKFIPILNKFKYILITYQKNFDSLDNVNYF